MSVTAGTIITIVRDLIPDPVYTAGVAQPASDGTLFRAQTLYRWLDDGVKYVAQQTGWTIQDWDAVQAIANNPWIDLDGKWITIELCFANGLQLWFAPEQYDVWPKPVTGTQPIQYSIHALTDHLQVRLFPSPSSSDPSTTINQAGGITATATSVTVAATTSFMAEGYVLIDSEILKYSTTTSTSLGALQRGQCGTAAATHANGATVQMLSVWIKGPRMPTEITASTDVVEVPTAFQPALQDYLLWKAHVAMNDPLSAKFYLETFRAEMARILADPRWRGDSQGVAILPYGVPSRGGLYFNQGPFGVIVP